MNTTTDTPMLELQNLTKTFGGQRALRSVDFAIYGGRVNALIGHNGSGKSTLIKVIAGYHKPDAGLIARVNGTETPIELVRSELNARFVHQDLALVSTLSAIDNLALINGYANRYRISMRDERRRAERDLAAFGIHFDVTLPMSQLRPLDRRLFAIARSLVGQLSVTTPALIVLDEPTDSLPRDEVQHVMDLIQRLATLGHGVLFISHRIDEVMVMADLITALRDGAIVGQWRREDATEGQLIGSITGLELIPQELVVDEELIDSIAGVGVATVPLSAPGADAPMIEVSGLYTEVLRDVSFELHSGEIVGLAGLEGSGREDLLALLAGARRWRSGRVKIRGKSFARLSPSTAIREGISRIPRDRMNEGGIGVLSIRENVLLSSPISNRPLNWITATRERREVTKWLVTCDVRPNEPEMVFGLLSGGNQQKVMLARSLRSRARTLLIDEPFQGVDVATRAAMKTLMKKAADEGCAVLLAAADPADLVEVCSRVLVMREGVIVDEFNGATITTSEIDSVTLASNLV